MYERTLRMSKGEKGEQGSKVEKAIATETVGTREGQSHEPA
eukprot:COSAG02_NODE_18269_length_949_cov_1.558824_1_plen_40_part_10